MFPMNNLARKGLSKSAKRYPRWELADIFNPSNGSYMCIRDVDSINILPAEKPAHSASSHPNEGILECSDEQNSEWSHANN